MPFGSLGIWEMLIIALIILVVFGPGRLPEIAGSLGKTLREFKKGMNEIQRELQEAERQGRFQEREEKGADTSRPDTRATRPTLRDAPEGSVAAEEERPAGPHAGRPESAGRDSREAESPGAEPSGSSSGEAPAGPSAPPERETETGSERES